MNDATVWELGRISRGVPRHKSGGTSRAVTQNVGASFAAQ